ncbi:MAG: 2Fe-2S iron-sulfur cluster binding domain-containing protein [Phycisphaerae bacterium]|nr:2Fe-2S iron-sulfur cluster binding domain-containing protein [Phycisphaerae bacterium]
MVERNPYIENADVQTPTRPYKVTIIDTQQNEHVIEVDPAQFPLSAHGRPGSILDIALANKIDLDHACGGVCACGTCHVIVKQGADTCNPPTDDEEDQLDDAYGVTANSRLACECVPNGEQDIIVVIPEWNRNLAREEH